MSHSEIEKLNQQFLLNTTQCRLQFVKGEGHIPVIEIKNSQASARISLQGAHLLSWVPEGETDVIWLSPDARFEKGKSVRGGIPICWPWFGAHEGSHEGNENFPPHGFARTVFWDVSDTCQLQSGETRIHFKLEMKQADEFVKTMWLVNTSVEYIVTIGTVLTLELITRNNGTENIEIGEALHTYFNVDDITKTTVVGLHEKEYLDKPDNFKRKKQNADIKISDEVDRVYVNAPDDVVINNQQRKILISKQGSQSTIVWNPGKQVAEKMGDLGEGGYLKMLCVESGNVAENVVSMAGGESHSLQVVYRLV